MRLKGHEAEAETRERVFMLLLAQHRHLFCLTRMSPGFILCDLPPANLRGARARLETFQPISL